MKFKLISEATLKKNIISNVIFMITWLDVIYGPFQ